MNIPNLLTLLRIILVPVMVICLIQGLLLRALIVFVIASITDGLDGFLARILKQKSILGAYLDPLADKALIASSFITLSIIDTIPGWLTVIVISRDFVILIGICVLVIMSIPFEVHPAFISKITTAFQLVTIFFSLMCMALPEYFSIRYISALFWATALVTIASGLNYIVKGVRYINNST
ncbi:MAG: CDP-alcohol phosphatidyltransferase family protein [Syntrophales bacterium]